MDYDLVSIFIILMPLLTAIIVELMERPPSRHVNEAPRDQPDGGSEVAALTDQ